VNPSVARPIPPRNASSVIEFNRSKSGCRFSGGLQPSGVCAAAGCISARLAKLKAHVFRAFRVSFADITGWTKVGEGKMCNENDYLEKDR